MTELITAESTEVKNRKDNDALLLREWLVTNGLGGYSSGTITGVTMRRYHGYLVAALPAPFGRFMVLNELRESLHFPDGSRFPLSGEESTEARATIPGSEFLTDFKLELGLPVWRYTVNGVVIERRVVMPHQQNTVHITYRMLSGEGPVRIDIRPAINFRSHDDPVSTPLAGKYLLTVLDDRYEFSAGAGLPRLRMLAYGQDSSFTFSRKNVRETVYRLEETLSSEGRGDLWSPGYFSVVLSARHNATLVASTERWETILTLRPTDVARAEHKRRSLIVEAGQAPARDDTGTRLLLAADQFIIVPAWRREDMARAHASGTELRTIIAGYHWLTDWGRDTMISLEGLTLATGRFLEARSILTTFAGYISDGLIPNTFPEGQKKGRYNTADATLWFFHALDRYLAYTRDTSLLDDLLPRLAEIVDQHVKGTRFGIGVDPVDGLLRQGEDGQQLTWMDSKTGDRVTTPRHGKAVEINALWYNALRLLHTWVLERGDKTYAGILENYASRAKTSFNGRFWYAEGSYLYDVVDGPAGDDASCRPNQVFALSLRHPVLNEQYWQRVLERVKEKLLTPAGLRSLSRDHTDYKERYYGSPQLSDAAYHQGAVWAWLIGPFIDAWVNAYPEDRQGARRFLEGLLKHLDEACVGSIGEVFDAEAPFTARGCIAQAWSIAEVLRCWIKTA